jgi:hypothetical protein
MDTILDQPFPKFDDESQIESCESQVGEELYLKDGIVPGRCLAFDDDKSVHQQVQA